MTIHGLPKNETTIIIFAVCIHDGLFKVWFLKVCNCKQTLTIAQSVFVITYLDYIRQFCVGKILSLIPDK